MDKQPNEHAGKKHRKGKAPVIIPRNISKWLSETTTNAHINNWKKGGGKEPWNK